MTTRLSLAGRHRLWARRWTAHGRPAGPRCRLIRPPSVGDSQFSSQVTVLHRPPGRPGPFGFPERSSYRPAAALISAAAGGGGGGGSGRDERGRPAACDVTPGGDRRPENSRRRRRRKSQTHTGQTGGTAELEGAAAAAATTSCSRRNADSARVAGATGAFQGTVFVGIGVKGEEK